MIRPFDAAGVSSLAPGGGGPVDLLLFWLGDDAELLHHAQVVEFAPVFHDLAIGNTQNVYPRNRYPVAGRSDAHELPLMGATHVHTSYYLISLGD